MGEQEESVLGFKPKPRCFHLFTLPQQNIERSSNFKRRRDLYQAFRKVDTNVWRNMRCTRRSWIYTRWYLIPTKTWIATTTTSLNNEFEYRGLLIRKDRAHTERSLKCSSLSITWTMQLQWAQGKACFSNKLG